MTFLANGVYVYSRKQTILILMLGLSKGRFCLSELFSFYKANFKVTLLKSRRVKRRGKINGRKRMPTAYISLFEVALGVTFIYMCFFCLCLT